MERTQSTDGVVFSPGLHEVMAEETTVSSLNGGLRYRGYAISDLVRQSTFMEVAYLLLNEELPTYEQLADFISVVLDYQELPDPVVDLIEAIPLHVELTDVIRSGISVLGHFDPQHYELEPASHIIKAQKLLATIPLLINTRFCGTRGLEMGQTCSDYHYAGNLLNLLTGREPSPLEERALDAALILHAEYEFAASSFAARVVSSTNSDYYSAITAGVGAIKGPRHGGANANVLTVFEEVQRPEEAQDWVRRELQSRHIVPGFGLRVATQGDIRASLLKPYCQELAEYAGMTEFEDVAEAVESAMKLQQGLLPNIAWPTARLLHYLGLDAELFLPLFIASRVVGWSAHIIEQQENERLIRPRSRYIGMDPRRYLPFPCRD